MCEDKAMFERVVTRSSYTNEEAARIGAAYLQIYKKQISRTCGNCLGDALAEMTALWRKNPTQMKKQNECRYALRAGMLFRLKFGDNVYYSNANLTDEVAEKYILDNPERLSDFQRFPPEIKEKIRGADNDEAGEKPVKSKKSVRKTEKKQ